MRLEIFRMSISPAPFGVGHAQGLNGGHDDSRRCSVKSCGLICAHFANVEHGNPPLIGLVNGGAVGMGGLFEGLRRLFANGVGGHKPQDNRIIPFQIGTPGLGNGVRRKQSFAAARGQAKADIRHARKPRNSPVGRRGPVRLLLPQSLNEGLFRIADDPGAVEVSPERVQGGALKSFELHSFLLSRLDLVGNLPEGNAFSLEPCGAQPATFTENHLRPVEGRKRRQNFRGQDVAAVGPFVAQNAVVKQVIAGALVTSQERMNPPGQRRESRSPQTRDARPREQSGCPAKRGRSRQRPARPNDRSGSRRRPSSPRPRIYRPVRRQ